MTASNVMTYEPLESPYDTTLDVALEIEKAKYQQSETGKKILLHIGANWCPDAKALAGMMLVPEIASFLGDHYIEVAFEIGEIKRPADYEKNTDIAASYGISPMEGVPTLLIIGVDDALLNTNETTLFRNARDRAPEEALAYFQKYA